MNSVKSKIEFPSDQIHIAVFKYNRDLWYYVDTNVHNENWRKTFEMIDAILHSIHKNED